MLGQDKTVIVVAHRQELIDFADKVIEVVPQSTVDKESELHEADVASEASAASVVVAADKAEEELL